MDNEEFKPMTALINTPNDLPNHLNATCLRYIEKRLGDVMNECLSGNGTIKATINYIEIEDEKVIASVAFVHDEKEVPERQAELKF